MTLYIYICLYIFTQTEQYGALKFRCTNYSSAFTVKIQNDTEIDSSIELFLETHIKTLNLTVPTRRTVK